MASQKVIRSGHFPSSDVMLGWCVIRYSSISFFQYSKTSLAGFMQYHSISFSLHDSLSDRLGRSAAQKVSALVALPRDIHSLQECCILQKPCNL